MWQAVILGLNKSNLRIRDFIAWLTSLGVAFRRVTVLATLDAGDWMYSPKITTPNHVKEAWQDKSLPVGLLAT